MTTHNIGFTYRPKIEAVKRGICRQTIRAKNKRRKRKGDLLNLYAWTGRPYRSPWAWRRQETCVEAVEITIYPEGIHFILMDYFREWKWLDLIAEMDYIDPPTGVELGRVLMSKNDISEDGVYGQIIRW